MPRDAPALNKKSTGSGPPWGQVWLKFKERQANTGNVAHVPKYICFYVKLNAFVMTESDSFTIENLTMFFLLKLIGVDLLAFWNVFAATCFSFFCTWSSPHYLRCATFFDSGREQLNMPLQVHLELISQWISINTMMTGRVLFAAIWNIFPAWSYVFFKKSFKV